MKTIVLAYSGGLDTSFCIPYLKEQGYSVIAATVDTGGFSRDEKEHIAEKAEVLGAEEYHLIDGKQDLYENYISYIIKGNVLRGGVYPLCAGPERYLVAQEVVQLAREKDAVAIAHGSTGAGNDQVRFDSSIQYLHPDIEIIAPIRELGISREEEVELLQKHGYEPERVSEDYSINQGLIGTTIGGKETTDSWSKIPEEVWPSVVSPEEAPDEGEEIIITFEDGLPVKLDEQDVDGVNLLDRLHETGAKHGVGRGIHIGDTILGVKGKIAFESPGLEILIKAHTELEKIVLTKHQWTVKNQVTEIYGDLMHEGHYFDPAMRDMEALIDQSQERVTGDVRVELKKGTLSAGGIRSPYSLLNQDVAVYGEENYLWDGRDAAGFCRIHGLQAMLAKKSEHSTE